MPSPLLLPALVAALPASAPASEAPSASPHAAMVVPAFRVVGPAPKPAPAIVINRRQAEARPLEVPVRAKPEWRDDEGFRIAGSRIAYSRRF